MVLSVVELDACAHSAKLALKRKKTDERSMCVTACKNTVRKKASMYKTGGRNNQKTSYQQHVDQRCLTQLCS